jgi:heme/copper-type cytochrome/quinol oxidase subunit 2
MPTARQLCSAVLVLDVGLFVLASAINDHSNTSVDGIVWYAAIFVFVALMVVGTYILVRYLWTHRRRPKRIRGR